MPEAPHCPPEPRGAGGYRVEKQGGIRFLPRASAVRPTFTASNIPTLAKKSKQPKGAKRDLRKEVIAVFHRNPRKPLNHLQVSAHLGIDDPAMRGLILELLNDAVATNTLTEPERGKFLLKDVPSDVHTGVIEITRGGRGFVHLDGFERDIEISKGNTGLSLYGDTVEIQFNPRARKPVARVVRVVERSRSRYVGIIELSKDHGFVLPSDQRIHADFYIPGDAVGGAKHGDKVVIEMVSWTDPERSPVGKVVQVLGRPGLHAVEMHAIIAEFDLPYAFPEDVLTESAQIAADFTAQELSARRDFRPVTTFTIDPYDAKDFDDALSFQRLPNGHTEVGVHIADVTHYVQPSMRTEQEALKRATSVYLVDRTIPMLPERLSNELCSLRPHEDKLCFSAVFELDDQARVVNQWFGRTIIHSDRRFTYEEAQEIIETGKGDFATEVLRLHEMAAAMRQRRFDEGAIDFDTEEVKFKLDEKGFPLGVTVKRMKESNRLIEEFMLLANRKVGEFVGKRKQGEAAKTFVYRIHDVPSDEKLRQLRNFLKNLGYKLPKPTESNSVRVIRSLLDQVAGHAEEDIIRQMAIRTMAKAAYATQNIGHYGLGFEFYTHFTSPIRRYPDMMAHRLLQHYLDGGSSVNAGDTETRCRHSSLMEKRAAEAERASIKYKQVEYMLMHEGQVFEGIVSGLSSWGIYVEALSTHCEGLVPLRNLKDDIYEFDEGRYVTRGLRKGKEFHMGDPVFIMVVSGDLQERKLEYRFVDGNKPS